MQTPLVLRLILALTLVAAAAFAAVRAQAPAPAPNVPLRAGDDDVEVSTFYQGEFDRPTYSLWGPRLACGIDLNAWALARCGGKRRWLFKPATNAESGNRCGYRGFVLVCFNR
jgi:hypothetical protein